MYTLKWLGEQSCKPNATTIWSWVGSRGGENCGTDLPSHRAQGGLAWNTSARTSGRTLELGHGLPEEHVLDLPSSCQEGSNICQEPWNFWGVFLVMHIFRKKHMVVRWKGDSYSPDYGTVDRICTFLRQSPQSKGLNPYVCSGSGESCWRCSLGVSVAGNAGNWSLIAAKTTKS